jgi:hypothetical protein
MIDKDFVAYNEFGFREYYPLVKKNYFSKHVNGLITNFFNNSPHSSFLLHHRNQFIISGMEDLKKKNDGELQKKKK